jgi:hypothetical protein
MAYTESLLLLERYGGAANSVTGNAYYSLIWRIVMVGAVTSD